jgi:hypothetical protein
MKIIYISNILITFYLKKPQYENNIGNLYTKNKIIKQNICSIYNKVY